jgi:predicted AAA+ superfamily ATPase
MIARNLASVITGRLAEMSAVALLGGRQVGKTTLARGLDIGKPSHYLDLEKPSDVAKLADAEYYLERHRGSLVILDEVQRVPGLFSVLRGIIDERRLAGDRVGHFLVLGSASPELLRQTAESLAGRISYLELAPLQLSEVGVQHLESHWYRGGYPESFLTPGDGAAMRWSNDLLTTYVERDLPQYGIRASPVELRRFLQMLAHQQGSTANYSALGNAIGWDQKTVKSHCELLESLFLLRRLPPWSGNLKKRLVKASKFYWRDSGLLHALLGIRGMEDLLGHPICGHSWEGYCLEQILQIVPGTWLPSFYRTHAGAEVDLVLENGRERILIEIKRSLAPKAGTGLREAIASLEATKTFILTPANDPTIHPIAPGIECLSLPALLDILSEYNW